LSCCQGSSSKILLANDDFSGNLLIHQPTIWRNAMKRREFIKKAGAGAIAAGAVIAGAPAVHAQKRVEITMVTTWPRDFPGLGTGAQRFANRLSNMTNGRMKVNYFAAGERVKPFDSFDEVASGNAQMYV
jgi:TRAP-type mannitol/chloroaromatic compound transport system substrate-binding protein